LSSADLIELYAKKFASASDDKKLKHVGRIKASVHNLTNILNDFLSLSKLEEERVQVSLVAFQLSEFCEEIVDELKGLLKNGQEIRYSCPVPAVEVLMDKKILKNIMYNLLSNAIKYSGENAPIECDIRLSENEVRIDIQDHGIGIPPEEQQHLFKRFFRANNAENIQGTGLGLNIVRKYLDLLDGDIAFESELGKGTKFSMRIPVQIKQPN
jgi:signal transduction histidine kinase